MTGTVAYTLHQHNALRLVAIQQVFADLKNLMVRDREKGIEFRVFLGPCCSKT